MKLGYFTFPIHPKNKNYHLCLKENMEEIILCDKIGFEEAFIGEHLTDEHERISSSQIFIASLINLTSKIKLATGTINLPHTNPAKVSANISMLDHMSKGRIIMGIGPGSLISDMEIMSTLKKNRNEMFLESINQILEIWRKRPPYNIKGKYWNITSKKTFDKKLSIGSLPKPYQKPHPEIVCTSLSNNINSIIALSKRGWNLLSSNFLHENSLRSHFKGIKSVRKKNTNWRVARKIFVNKNKSIVNNYVFSSNSPYYKVISQILNKLKKYNRLDVFKKNPKDKKEKIDLDKLMKSLVICGDPNEVVERIIELKEQIGNFNTITYVGMDWKSPKLAKDSLKLMANNVMHKI